MSKNVIVPKADLDQLEEARKYLHKLIGENFWLRIMVYSGVSDVMWRLTHRKYQEV